MRAATVVLAVMLALSCAEFVEGQTGTTRDGVPILMPPVPFVDVPIVERAVGVAHDDVDFFVSQLAEPSETPAMYHGVLRARRRLRRRRPQ